MIYITTKKSFIKDVANHQLNILKDDGVYRHIRMAKPNSSDMHYDIVTYPGYLVYSGDMGCFVFSCVDDMFTFFRDEREDWHINTGYWAEKLQAVDRVDGYKEFSWDRFVENLMEFCETDEQKDWMKDDLKYVEHDEFGACQFYREFDNDNEHGIDLSDLFEYSSSQETNRYLWCCYAIVWAIRQYDMVKE